ncbi:O-antigen ligase family protein [Georgenia sp.]
MAFFFLSHPRVLIPQMTTSLAVVLGVAVTVAVVNFRDLRRSVVPVGLAALLAFFALSVLWSINRADSVRAVVFYALIALVACLIVANCEVDVLLQGAVWGAVAVSIAAYAAIMLDVRAVGPGPLWVTPVHGVVGNRNILSYTLLLGLGAVLSYRPPGRLAAVRRLVPFVLVLGTLVLSRSGTGAVSAVVLLTAWGGWHLVTRLGRSSLPLLGLALITATGAVLLNAERIIGVLGKDGTLSGRVPLWRGILDVTSESPWGGYGWGGVWTYSWLPASGSEVKNNIDAAAGSYLSHGHNLVLDVLPQVGIVGTALLLAVLVAAVGRALAARGGQPSARLWIVLTVLVLLVAGLTEPMASTPLGWFHLAAVAALATRLRREAGR